MVILNSYSYVLREILFKGRHNSSNARSPEFNTEAGLKKAMSMAKVFH